MKKLLVKNLIESRRAQLSSHARNLADSFLYALDASDYIDDAIHDVADNSVDYEYIHLRRWLYENDTDCSCTYPDEVMHDVVSACLIDTRDYDFYKHIQIAQSLSYEEILHENLPPLLFIKALMIAAETRETITESELAELNDLHLTDYNSLREIRIAVERLIK